MTADCFGLINTLQRLLTGGWNQSKWGEMYKDEPGQPTEIQPFKNGVIADL